MRFLGRVGKAAVATAGLTGMLALGGCLGDRTPVAPCAQVAEVETPAARDALVDDETGSMAGHGLPEGMRAELGEEQKAGRGLALVGVDGQSKDVDLTLALDPEPGVESLRADRARQVALDCVGQALTGPQARPRTAGSAIVEALGTASRQNPAKLLVYSDGESNAGAFNLNDVGFDVDPTSFADELAQAGSLAPTLRGRQVIWYGLGESARPLPEGARSALRETWTAILTKAGAAVQFDTVTGAGAQMPANLPGDEVRVPGSTVTRVGCQQQYELPADLLFQPDDATLTADAVTALGPVGGQLSEHPDWTGDITGHTAFYGTAPGRARLSQQRADTVRTALHDTYDIALDRTTARGVGATEPARPEILPGGRHDLAAAARNRRVVILIGPKGCSR